MRWYPDSFYVIPAKAGIQERIEWSWTPACVGVTSFWWRPLDLRAVAFVSTLTPSALRGNDSID